MFYPLGKQDFKFGFVMLGWFNTRLWIFLTFPSQSTVVAKQQQEWCVQRPPWPNNKDASGITLRDAGYNAQHCCVHQSNGAYKQSIFCGPGLKSQIRSLCLCTCLSESTPRVIWRSARWTYSYKTWCEIAWNMRTDLQKKWLNHAHSFLNLAILSLIRTLYFSTTNLC